MTSVYDSWTLLMEFHNRLDFAASCYVKECEGGYSCDGDPEYHLKEYLDILNLACAAWLDDAFFSEWANATMTVDLTRKVKALIQEKGDLVFEKGSCFAIVEFVDQLTETSL